MIPPKAIAIIVMRIENAMLIRPPVFRRSAREATSVSGTKPFIPVSKSVPMVQFGWKIKPRIEPDAIPMIRPGIAGIFRAIATITISGGSNRIGLILNISSRAFESSVTELISIDPL